MTFHCDQCWLLLSPCNPRDPRVARQMGSCALWWSLLGSSSSSFASGTLQPSVSLPPWHSRGVGVVVREGSPVPGLLLPPDEDGRWWWRPRTYTRNTRIPLFLFNNCFRPVVSDYFSFLLHFCLDFILRVSTVSIVVSIFLTSFSWRPFLPRGTASRPSFWTPFFAHLHGIHCFLDVFLS